MKNNVSREEILKQAGLLIAQYGYSKTTINDIARACGKTKTFLYHYFPNKESILNEVIDRQIDTLFLKLVDSVNHKQDPRDKIRIYVLTRITLIKQIATFYISFREDYITSHSIVEKVRYKYDIREIGIIASILEQGKKSGVFNIDEPKTVAQAFVIALKGFEYIWATSNSDDFSDNKIDNMLNVFFYGIVEK